MTNKQVQKKQLKLHVNRNQARLINNAANQLAVLEKAQVQRVMQQLK